MARRNIKLLDKLGEGQFGDVFKGTVNEVMQSSNVFQAHKCRQSDATGVPEYIAAIKTLKEDPSGEEKAELMQEAATVSATCCLQHLIWDRWPNSSTKTLLI